MSAAQFRQRQCEVDSTQILDNPSTLSRVQCSTNIHLSLSYRKLLDRSLISIKTLRYAVEAVE